jgi:hypothetical protein
MRSLPKLDKIENGWVLTVWACAVGFVDVGTSAKM